MKTLTRKLTLISLALCMILCCSFAMFTFSARASELTIYNSSYGLYKGASVKVGLNEENEFDYNTNGIRFMVTMPAAEYTALEDDTVSYGILIAPYDYIEKYGALNAANVFGVGDGAVQKYNFDGSNGLVKIANVETETLAYNAGNAEKGVAPFYYYNASMVKLLPENVERQFVAVAYLKQTTVDQYQMSETNYHFVENENMLEENVRSMSYVAQIAIEDATMDTDVKAAITEAYIANRETDVTVTYKKSYDGDGTVSKSATVKFALGEELTAQKVNEKLVAANVIDANYVLDESADNVDGVKVYADGKTAAVEVNYNVAEADAADYKKMKGMYLQGENGGAMLFADKTISGELGYGTYKLYVDGTVKSVMTSEDGDATYFGSYSIKDGATNFSLTDNSATLDYEHMVEFNSTLRQEIVGMYKETDGTILDLGANGSVTYGDKSGSYMFVYDETKNMSEDLFYLIMSFTDGSSKVQAVSGNLSMEGFTEIANATKEQYAALAEYYTEKTSNVIYKFNTDGTIVSAGTEVGNFKMFSDGSITATIDGNAVSGTFTENSSAVYTRNVIALADKDQTVSYNLVHSKVASYNVYDIFADADGVIYYGDVESTVSGYVGRKGQIKLFNTKTTVEKLITDGETDWYQCAYKGIYGWLEYEGVKNLAYRLIPTTYENGICVGGTFELKHSNGYGKSTTFGITEDGKLWVDVQWTPNGNDGTYCKQYAKSEELVAPSVSVYDIFASAEGTLYHHGNAWYGVVTLLNEADVQESGWYKGYYDFDGNMTNASHTATMKYQLSELINGVGTLKMKNNSSTREHKYGIINGIRWIDMRNATINGGVNSSYPTETGEFTIKFFNNSNRTNARAAVIQQEADYQKLYDNIGDGETGEVVDVDLYTQIAGTYTSKKAYGSNTDWWWSIGIKLTAEGGASMTQGMSSSEGSYELIPYTDTFGKILFDPNYSQTHLGEIYEGYYIKINGEFVFRIIMNAAGVKYWHFMDFTKSGSTFSSWDIFDAVVGTESDATYTDGTNTLKLELLANNFNSENYIGSKFVFTAGETVVNGTYDFVATSLTAGKIFLDFNPTPKYSDDKERYVIGEYALINGEYVISFTYKGTDYLMNLSGNTDAQAVVKSILKGSYVGTANKTLVIDDTATFVATDLYNGTVTMGDITATYVIKDGRVILSYNTGAENFDDVVMIKAI